MMAWHGMGWDVEVLGQSPCGRWDYCNNWWNVELTLARHRRCKVGVRGLLYFVVERFRRGWKNQGFEEQPQLRRASRSMYVHMSAIDMCGLFVACACRCGVMDRWLGAGARATYSASFIKCSLSPKVVRGTLQVVLVYRRGAPNSVIALVLTASDIRRRYRSSFFRFAQTHVLHTSNRCVRFEDASLRCASSCLTRLIG